VPVDSPGELDALAELVGEGELFLVRQVCLREHQNAAILKRLPADGDSLVVKQVSAVDMDDAADMRLGRFNGDTHDSSFPLHSPMRFAAIDMTMDIGMPGCISPLELIVML
jgi:hypothetical protein